ncbi:hypothetical protein [Rhizobium leguminosarum]|uniref:hypothetical protein n=1 Tax=Rhizobium leguminosarum TaxID=384 RepID=UPI0014426C80|nr:hypothetical protein [Rhizobium leguminosarum]NKL94184.1 hypothetical protein [Rhizobium leguminosarum bv. viciae]
MATSPDKTFGLRSSTDLYLKLIYDIDRLRSGGSTRAVQYAAFDAAITASHILDWVLHELDEVSYLRLTGVGKGKKGAVGRFIQRNGGMLGGLEFCRQIANSVKYVTITMGPVMTNMSTGSTVKLEWQGDRIINAYAQAFIKIDDQKYSVIELFQSMAEQWFLFLEIEGLWVEQPPEE